jgi:hypothetical protein
MLRRFSFGAFGTIPTNSSEVNVYCLSHDNLLHTVQIVEFYMNGFYKLIWQMNLVALQLFKVTFCG